MSIKTIVEQVAAFAYLISGISGGAGGCLVAAQQILRGRRVTLWIFLAYCFAGLIFGLTGGIVSMAFFGISRAIENTILLGIVFGVAGAGSLAGMNLSARFILKRLGIEIDINVRDVSPLGPKDDD